MKVFDPFLNGTCNASVQLWDLLRDRTFACLHEHTRRKEAISTSDAIIERATMIREAFLNSIGGLPPSDTPLNARTVGIMARPGYHIEKVVFESEPTVYVTAHLYIPDVMELPAPGILFVSGHGREAKAYDQYQRVCHDIAINGMVALAIDPTGQGERVTTLNPDTGEMSHGWGTTEHSYQGQQCILTGTNLARYFLHDALRGIDYLMSRPEVDGERIGITGNSGGGTQTSLVCMSGDPRIKAAAPCTYVTSREAYYATGQPQDAEQLQFAMTSNGINYDDMFYPFAPRPLLIGAVRSDFFSPEGTLATYERLRKVYRILGDETGVELAWAPGGHAYHAELRQRAVNWFRKHLLHAAPDFQTAGDEAIETLPDSELWCTPKGHVLTQYPDARTPYHLNLEQIPSRPRYAGRDGLRTALVRALYLESRLKIDVPLAPRTLNTQKADGLSVDSVCFVSEPGIMVSAAYVRPADVEPRTAVVRLTPDGTEAFSRDAATALDARGGEEGVLIVDVRGTGAVKAAPVNPYGDTFPNTFFNTDAWFATAAYCAGESLLGMRVFDVMRAIDYLLQEREVEAVKLNADGLQPALWGYLAAALHERVLETRVDGLIESFEAVARTQFYRLDITPSLLSHGLLKQVDLPEVAALFEGRRLDVTHVPVS